MAAAIDDFGVRIARFQMRRMRVNRIQSKSMVVTALAIFVGALLGITATAQTKPVAAKPAAASAPANAGKGFGSKSAPITIEVFGDFQCPACRAFYEATMKQVIDNYVNTGKVYVVHRDFPLPMHPYAVQAAQFANAAADLGEFEQVERALYDKQDDWSPNGKIDEAISSTISPAEVKKIHDYESQHMADINASIQRDKTMGESRAVAQTPTIYVTAHGKTEALPGGGVNYDLMKKYLDFLLRQ
jgi:protein-disulfide isomerase